MRPAALLALAVVVALGLALAGPAAAAPDPGFELRAPDHVDVAVGAAGAASLTVTPAGGRTVSADGPLQIDVSSDDGVALPRRRYALRDAADAAAEAPRFDLRFKAVAAGDHVLSIDVRFWLCGARTCRPVRAQRTVTVRVVPAR